MLFLRCAALSHALLGAASLWVVFSDVFCLRLVCVGVVRFWGSLALLMFSSPLFRSGLRSGFFGPRSRCCFSGTCNFNVDGGVLAVDVVVFAVSDGAASYRGWAMGTSLCGILLLMGRAVCCSA